MATGRTVPGTVSAFYSVGERHAVFLYPYGMAYLRGRLVRKCDRAYCSSRTDIAASRTFRAAVTAFVAHFRLHQPHQVGSGTKHLVRTCRHAQLAGGAVPGKMLRAPCTRRHDRRIAVRNLFVFDDCQSAVYLLFLCLQGNGCCHQSGCGKEAAPGRPFAFVCGGSFRFRFPDALLAEGSRRKTDGSPCGICRCSPCRPRSGCNRCSGGRCRCTKPCSYGRTACSLHTCRCQSQASATTTGRRIPVRFLPDRLCCNMSVRSATPACIL